MYTKLSNVIGAPFDEYVLDQLEIRAKNNSTETRTDNQVLFLANKTGWARLVSSVDVNLPVDKIKDFYKALRLNDINYPDPESLARNWILEAGTSTQIGDQDGINLRAGIGLGETYAYGLGGVDELGYRPMPGLTSVQIQTMGTLGSLRQATINFKVWNINQLNTIEALYFRFGYSMLLEWGHTQYFTNNGTFIKNGIFGIQNPFVGGKRKERIQQEIARKAKNTYGNYDGMLGIVSNYTWAFNQSGGYDCTLRLVGLGAIMDSLRINQSKTFPQGLIARFKQDISLLDKIAQQQQEAQVVPVTPTIETQTVQLPPIPKTLQEAYTVLKTYGGYTGDFSSFLLTYSALRTSTSRQSAANSVTPIQSINSAAAYLDSFKQSDKVSAEVLAAAKSKFEGLYIFYADRSIRVPPGESRAVLNFALIDSFIGEYLRQFPQEDKPKSNLGETVLYANPLLRLVQRKTDTYTTGTGVEDNPLDNVLVARSFFSNRTTNLYEGITARFFVQNPVRTDVYKTGNVNFVFSLNIKIVDPAAQDYLVTRRQILEALYTQVLEQKLYNVRIKSVEKGDRGATYTGEFTVTVAANLKKTIQVALATTKNIEVIFEFVTNNPAFINASDTQEVVIPPSLPNVQAANTGDTGGTVNTPNTEQVDSPKGFQSSLHAMLTIVRAQVQASTATLGSTVSSVDITGTTKEFYSSGILNGVLSEQVPTNVGSDQEVPFEQSKNLLQYALKGFNSDLMVEPRNYSKTPTVDFKKLCTAYIIRYPQAGVDGTLSQLKAPVYIPFGYLLAFINNMCLVYDSTVNQVSNQSTNTSNEARPYLYIDFNPETNFCLTLPQQFSIDPTVCMVPFQATLDQYQGLFPQSVKKPTSNSSIPALADGANTPIYNPETNNAVSATILQNNPFQSLDNPYRGKVMNILLNVDYLLGIIDSYQGNDPEHGVYLQSFLERVLVDVNKSLGDVNLFRIAYRDDSNTIQIQDAQWTPGLAEEASAMKRRTRDSRGIPLGELPIFGQQSLAREFQLKTVVSTKLASMIAISAQASTGSVNSTDHSPYSWLNENFKDRYKPYIQDVNKGSSSTSKTGVSNNNDTGNEVKAASTFNSQVQALYSNPGAVEQDKIDMAKNYYIELMSKAKSTNPVTVSAPFIPADLEITLDGVSGIIMGNAFLIPENRLPLSLRGDGGDPKVGFIVTGLNHTIERNQWLTNIRGQMIKLRDNLGTGKVAVVEGTATSTPPVVPEGNAGERYPGACYTGRITYAGTKQVLAPESVNSQNYTTKYYPGYRFVKGVSDINLAALNLQPLTEREIVDDTLKNRFLAGTITSPIPYFVVHHTAGRGTAEDVYRTFYCTGLPTQYVIDRNGVIHRFMPDGTKGQHARQFNSKSIGVEIIAKNDSDVLEVQKNAAIRLAQFLGFKIKNIVGHGKISSQKEATEGFKVVNALNPGYTARYDPTYG